MAQLVSVPPCHGGGCGFESRLDRHLCRCSSMVEHDLAMVDTGVRFPSSAPLEYSGPIIRSFFLFLLFSRFFFPVLQDPPFLSSLPSFPAGHPDLYPSGFRIQRLVFHSSFPSELSVDPFCTLTSLSHSTGTADLFSLLLIRISKNPFSSEFHDPELKGFVLCSKFLDRDELIK